MSLRPEPSDEPPAKRRKLQPEVQRSPDFWFRGGDFVLIANQKLAYRIHVDVLGRKSKVFSDLLNLNEIPRPDSEDMMDGRPVMHITDSSEDFDTFLHLIYDGFERHREHAKSPRWATVRVMIQLGDKYDVSEIYAEGLRQLRGWYAEDIKDWDNRDEKFFAYETDHLSVASITRTLDEPDLHAAVLYHCCRLPPSRLVTGYPATGCPPLCTDDLTCTLNYLKGLSQDYLDFLQELFGSVYNELKACAKCCQLTQDVKTTVENYTQEEVGYNAHRILDLRIWTAVSGAVKQIICKNCFLHYKSRLRQMRQSYRLELLDHVAPLQNILHLL